MKEVEQGPVLYHTIMSFNTKTLLESLHPSLRGVVAEPTSFREPPTAMLAASESVRADRVGEPVNVPVDDANDPVFTEAIEVAPVETPIEVYLTVASVEPVVGPESVDPVA